MAVLGRDASPSPAVAEKEEALSLAERKLLPGAEPGLAVGAQRGTSGRSRSHSAGRGRVRGPLGSIARELPSEAIVGLRLPPGWPTAAQRVIREVGFQRGWGLERGASESASATAWGP